MKTERKNVVIYGGNGFVGSHCAQALVTAGANVVCLSRSGHKPLHLGQDAWSKEVRWCKGDAASPDTELLKQFDAVICAVGSPPLPTFSSKAYERQLFMNGTTCKNAIEGASQAGVEQIVLINAQIPFFMRTEYFGYYKGKSIAYDAAQAFAQQADNTKALVLKPGMITGKRYLSNGKCIRLDIMTKPFSPIMPWQFVTVERVASRVKDAVMNPESYVDAFTVLKNTDI